VLSFAVALLSFAVALLLLCCCFAAALLLVAFCLAKLICFAEFVSQSYRYSYNSDSGYFLKYTPHKVWKFQFFTTVYRRAIK
jgi:hypothetical protein